MKLICSSCKGEVIVDEKKKQFKCKDCGEYKLFGSKKKIIEKNKLDNYDGILFE